MPKTKRDRAHAQRHAPLGNQIVADEAKKQVAPERKNRQGKRRVREKMEGEEAEIEGMVSADLSRKILSVAREQLEEEKEARAKNRQASAAKGHVDSDDDLPFGAGGSDDEDEEDEEYEVEYLNQDEFANLKVDAEDERVLEAFMNKDKPARRTLADIIMEKIKEKEAAAEEIAQAKEERRESGLNPRLIEVYQSIGKLLSRYRAGKIPKAFKIVPALRNWEEVLYHTDPDEWSPQAMRAATRLFASNLNDKMAQRFYALVLLPAVRDDIQSNKKLNYHLYMALKKSMYRSKAFFKGILLPLCEGQDCTLREAAIIGSVLSKVSIPMLDSAAAMLKMASMPYSGATSLFLRVLLDKKYSLPYKVVDQLVVHFVAFRDETRRLPVLWHQSLLVFAQRYKTVMTDEQKEALKPLLKQHFHHMITPEIRRELFNSTSRQRKH
ncbi:Bystin [Hondaea fermentalgiana]|uniref:Bystin n=1 Tax=Hondaea fermentalgiana TaxID=2315210 RepID=A0A2R5FZ93_9STRA|nr:Bystin [Hondaea fermentalgiana]|eukprot:GBG24067.1 Bystin [Hondaea fermentalgiana]